MPPDDAAAAAIRRPRWSRCNPSDSRDRFRRCESDLGALRLQLEFAEGMRGAGPEVDHLAIHDVADRIAIADRLLPIPLSGGSLHVMAAAEAESTSFSGSRPYQSKRPRWR